MTAGAGERKDVCEREEIPSPPKAEAVAGSYVAVDLETTGLHPKMDRILEIGAVRVIDGEVAGEYRSFVRPGRLLDEKITELTGITDDMVADAPEAGEVIGEVVKFCGDLPLLGHLVLFDYSFLKRAAVNQGIPFERDGIDTLKLCRQLMPEEEKKNLRAACAYFGVSLEHAHRALDDARAAHQLYQALKNKFSADRPELFSVKNLIYKVKKEQPATKTQKEHLRTLLKYHKINLTVQIDSLSRNEISRITDKIISHYGRL